MLHRHVRDLDVHQPGGEGIRGRSDGGQKASEACSASWLSSHWGHCGQHHYYDRHWYYHQHQHVKLFCLTITLISRWAFLWLHFSNFQSKYSFLRRLFGLWSNSAVAVSLDFHSWQTRTLLKSFYDLLSPRWMVSTINSNGNTADMNFPLIYRT